MGALASVWLAPGVVGAAHADVARARGLARPKPARAGLFLRRDPDVDFDVGGLDAGGVLEMNLHGDILSTGLARDLRKIR